MRARGRADALPPRADRRLPPRRHRPRSPCPPPAAAGRRCRTPRGRGAARGARPAGPRRAGRPTPPRPPDRGGAAATLPRVAPPWWGREPGASPARRLHRPDLCLQALENEVGHLERPQAVPATHRRALALAHGAEEGIDLALERVDVGHVVLLHAERRLAVGSHLPPADEDSALPEVDRQVGVLLEDAELPLALERHAAGRPVRAATVREAEP